jgi:dihydroorotase
MENENPIVIVTGASYGVGKSTAKLLSESGYHVIGIARDIDQLNTIKNENIESKCGWTPFNGFQFKGTPTHTIVMGKIKMQDGKILGDPEGTPLQFN